MQTPTLVTVAGEIDIATAPALRLHLLALPGRDAVLEVSGVLLLSAAGLAEVVDLHDRLTRADARLALAGASPLLRKLLAVTRLDETLLLAETVDDAACLLRRERCEVSGPAGVDRAGGLVDADDDGSTSR